MTTLAVGDAVRVKQSGGKVGDTIYEVVTVEANDRCTIREPGYASQWFYQSMLVKAGA